MAYYTGETVTDNVILTDASNNPITGATLTVMSATDPGGNAFVPTITEQGGGVYRVTFPVATAGTWSLWVRYAGPPVQDFAQTYDVDAVATDIEGDEGAGSGWIASVATTVGGITRIELIGRLAARLNDRYDLRAEGGDASTLIDSRHLVDDVDHYEGSELLMRTGANAGEHRYVASSSRVHHSVSVQPAFQEPIQPGDDAWLINLSGQGAMKEDYIDAINFAIMDAQDLGVVPVILDSAAAFTIADFSDHGSFTLPENITYLSRVLAMDDYGTYLPLSRSGTAGVSGWRQAGAGVIQIIGDDAAYTNGRLTRLIGWGPPPTLEADDERTAVNPSWLFWRAFAWLLQQTAKRGRPMDQGEFNMAEGEARRLERRLVPTFPHNTERVR